MSTETMMTAATTTEGHPASATAGTPATGAEQPGQQQQAGEGQGVEVGKTGESSAADGAGVVEVSGDGEGGKPTTEGEKPPGAPEKYEFKAPEGQEFDAQVTEQFSEVARELNLTQEAAQKVLDKMAPALAARQTEVLEAARNQWAVDAKADKEFGGAKLQENLAVAKTALDQLGTPALRDLLNESGLGNHPEVLRVFFRAGKAISEDRFVGGNAGGKGQQGGRDHAATLYPDQKS